MAEQSSNGARIAQSVASFRADGGSSDPCKFFLQVYIIFPVVLDWLFL
jgi:hypothetical protein